jgi:hypothetical protein
MKTALQQRIAWIAILCHVRRSGTTDARALRTFTRSRSSTMRSSVLRLLAVAGLSAGFLGCSDSQPVTAPAGATGNAASNLLLSSPAKVNAVTRDAAITTPQTASAVIGIFGGRITLPDAGLTVVIPMLAVTSPTLISVTAVPGREIAYEFEPHGKHFLLPLRVTQSLAGTSASANGILPSVLYAGYFPDVSQLDQVNATAVIDELLGTSINLWNSSVTFSISHFSGYLIATGLTDSSGDSGDGSQ